MDNKIDITSYGENSKYYEKIIFPFLKHVILITKHGVDNRSKENINYKLGTRKILKFKLEILFNNLIIYFSSLFNDNFLNFLTYLNKSVKITTVKMSDDEMEKFEITDFDLDNEFNMNRPQRRLTKNQAIYGNISNIKLLI